MDKSFRHNAGYGKSMEYKLIGQMLAEDLDCYIPLVDDHGVDCVIKRSDGVFIEVQIKASSRKVKFGDTALFAAISHTPAENFYFVFYSERLEKMLILSSEEFTTHASKPNSKGKNIGQRSIKFNGVRTSSGGVKEEYILKKYEKYVCEDFSKFY